MAGDIERATETSPLLDGRDSSRPIASNGVGTAGGDTEDGCQNGDTVGREGLPHLAAKMHLLVPAVGIGVSRFSTTNPLPLPLPYPLRVI